MNLGERSLLTEETYSSKQGNAALYRPSHTAGYLGRERKGDVLVKV